MAQAVTWLDKATEKNGHVTTAATKWFEYIGYSHIIVYFHIVK